LTGATVFAFAAFSAAFLTFANLDFCAVFGDMDVGRVCVELNESR
jgi:hypothetical protein